MFSHVWRLVIGGWIAFNLFSPSQASAGIILVTSGETISHLGTANDTPPNGSIRVGYKYAYYGVFWVDFWTSGGTYCVYEGKMYNPIAASEAAELLGKKESDMQKPFLYQIPLGWLIVVPLVSIAIIRSLLKTDEHAFLRDSRYLKAVEIVYEQLNKSKPTPPTQEQTGEGSPSPPSEESDSDFDKRFQAAFEAGVQHLVASDIPRDEAVQKLHLMFQAIAHNQMQQKAAAGTPEAPAGNSTT